jgi:hypothetical protein
MESNEVDDRAAAEAELSSLRADRTALAERVLVPWWYDALLSLLVFGLLSSYSARSNWVTLSALAVFLLGLGGMKVLYQRLTGVWVNGFRKGATRRAIHVWLAAYGVLLSAAAVAEYLLDLRGAMVVGGAVIAVVLYAVNRWWTRIYVAELREGL